MVAYLTNPIRPPTKDAKSGLWTLSGNSLNWVTLDRVPLTSYNPIVTHQITGLVCDLWADAEAEAAVLLLFIALSAPLPLGNHIFSYHCVQIALQE